MTFPVFRNPAWSHATAALPGATPLLPCLEPCYCCPAWSHATAAQLVQVDRVLQLRVGGILRMHLPHLQNPHTHMRSEDHAFPYVVQTHIQP